MDTRSDLNVSQDELNDSPSPVLTQFRSVLLSVIVSMFTLFIIISNAMLIYCIQRNRKMTWAKQTRQTFHLIVCDLIVGILLVPVFISQLIVQQKGYVFCAVITFTSMSSQAVSYYHMLAVCIHRYRMVKKIHLQSWNDRYKYGVESCVIWTTVLLASVPPCVVWGRRDVVLETCRIDLLFGPSDKPAIIYFLLLYCLPWVLTNVIYAVTLCCLWMRLSAVQPLVQTVFYRHDPNSQRYERSRDPCNASLIPVSLTIQTPVLTAVPTYNRARTKRVVKVVGYLLFVLNISMLSPMITHSMRLSGNTKYIYVGLMALTYLNNISNPFIYSLSIAPLRDEMRTVMTTTFSRLQAIVM